MSFNFLQDIAELFLLYHAIKEERHFFALEQYHVDTMEDNVSLGEKGLGINEYSV